jgi:hypothetical protein
MLLSIGFVVACVALVYLLERLTGRK